MAMTNKEKRAAMAALEARYHTSREFRDDANKWNGWDGRTSRAARGVVTLKGNVRSKDRPTMDPVSGREFHVRYVKPPQTKPNHKRTTPKAGHVLDSMMNATVRGGSLNYR